VRRTKRTLGFCIQQLVAEGVPVAVLARLLDDNLFPIVRDLVDDVFGVLA